MEIWKVRVKGALSELWSDGRGRVLLLVSAGWLLSFGTRFIFPALLPELRLEFGMDHTTAGLLMSSLWLAYGIGQFPGGIFGDYLGERRTLTASTAIAAASVLLVTFSPDVTLLFVSVIGFGLATALYGPTSFTVPADLYEHRDATATGIVMAAGHAGSSILPLIAGVLATTLVWTAGLTYVVPLFCLVGAGLWLVIPDRTGASDAAFGDVVRTASRVRTAITQRSVTSVAFLMSILVFIIQGLTSFYPAYLVEIKGIPADVAAAVFAGFFGVGIVTAPIAGAVADRFSSRRTMVGLGAVLTASFFALPFVGTIPGIVLVTIGLSSLLATIPVALSYLTAALPPSVRGSGFGLIRTVYFLLSSTGPVIVGAMADRDLFDEAFVLLGVMSVGAIVVIVLLPARNRRYAHL